MDGIDEQEPLVPVRRKMVKQILIEDDEVCGSGDGNTKDVYVRPPPPSSAESTANPNLPSTDVRDCVHDVQAATSPMSAMSSSCGTPDSTRPLISTSFSPPVEPPLPTKSSSQEGPAAMQKRVSTGSPKDDSMSGGSSSRSSSSGSSTSGASSKSNDRPRKRNSAGPTTLSKSGAASRPTARRHQEASDDSDESSSGEGRTSHSTCSSGSSGSESSRTDFSTLSSGDEDSDSDSDGSGSPRRRRSPPTKASPAKKGSIRRTSPQKGSTKKSGPSSDTDDEGASQPFVRTGRSHRDTLIAHLLSRWWYVMPEWPPPDFDYEAVLNERKLKQVSLDDWEDLDDVDEEGRTKVYQVSHFSGVFRDPSGAAIDLRPAEGKPSYQNMNTLSDEVLSEMLVTALENQIAQLKNSPYWNTDADTLVKLEARLRSSLARAKNEHTKCIRRKEYKAKMQSPS